MARLHLRFRNIHAGARRAGSDLFDARPWSGTEEEQQTKFEKFLSDASEAYGLPTPTLAIVESSDVMGLVAPNTIVLPKYSVISLFNAFRQHLQYHEAINVAFLDRYDSQAWACSLFYTLRPIAFRKAVREGTIVGVRADDLLTSASLAARQEVTDEVFAGIVDNSFGQDEIDALEDESADGEDDVAEVAADSLLDAAEAAQRLGVSTSTIRNMCRDGRLQEVRVGRRRFVTEASVAVAAMQA